MGQATHKQLKRMVETIFFAVLGTPTGEEEFRWTALLGGVSAAAQPQKRRPVGQGLRGLKGAGVGALSWRSFVLRPFHQFRIPPAWSDLFAVAASGCGGFGAPPVGGGVWELEGGIFPIHTPLPPPSFWKPPPQAIPMSRTGIPQNVQGMYKNGT